MGKLSSKALAKLDAPGRYADGDGLYLFVDSKQRRYWQLRYMIAGRRRDMAIGPERNFSLAQAREAAMKLRLTLIQGLDPLEERKAAEVAGTTFAEAARTVHTARAAGWRNGKHKDQWLATLEKHVFPLIGDKRLREIERADVLSVLEPIWLSVPETARRVRQRVAAVIDWGVGAGVRQAGIDMRIVTRALPKHSRKQRNFRALEYEDVPSFIKALPLSPAGPKVRAAIEMLVLTASRPGNIRLMLWDEIDFENAVWTIAADKMKMDREHRVPLQPRALEILRSMQDVRKAGEIYVFPGITYQQPMSLDTLRMSMGRMGFDTTAHGFRSCFKGWCQEEEFADSWSELALAHVDQNKARAAYARKDLLEKRRKMMTAWADFIAGSRPVPVSSEPAR